MNTALGRLERVDPRKVWETEDRHFTPWLAQEDNLRLLSEAIGIELEQSPIFMDHFIFGHL